MVAMGVVLLAGLALIVLPISPNNHYHYKGTVVIDNQAEYKLLEREFAIKADKPLVDYPKEVLSQDGHSVYFLDLDAREKLEIDDLAGSLIVKEIKQDDPWVWELASCMIFVSFWVCVYLTPEK